MVNPSNKEDVYIDAENEPEIQFEDPPEASKQAKELARKMLNLMQKSKRKSRKGDAGATNQASVYEDQGRNHVIEIIDYPSQLASPGREKNQNSMNMAAHHRISSAPHIAITDNNERIDPSAHQSPTTKFKQTGSRFLDYARKKTETQEDDPEYLKAHNKRIAQRVKSFREQSRWLPNSAFQTYYGKAPFENYGRGNTNPVHGGPVYGQYMKTHNINPYRGGNNPQYKQVYDRAELQSEVQPNKSSSVPRKRPTDLQFSDQQIQDFNSRNQLLPEEFEAHMKKKLSKPNLMKAIVFESAHNSPPSTPKRA